MKLLRLQDAVLYFEMRDNETQDEAVDRLLKALDSIGADISVWGEESVIKDDE